MPLPALAGKGIIGYGRLATHRVTPANNHQRGTGGEQQHDCARDASDSGTRLGDAGIAAVLATVGTRRTGFAGAPGWLGLPGFVGVPAFFTKASSALNRAPVALLISS